MEMYIPGNNTVKQYALNMCYDATFCIQLTDPSRPARHPQIRHALDTTTTCVGGAHEGIWDTA